MKYVLVALSLAGLTLSASAEAEEKQAVPQTKNVITLKVIDVYGRAPRPAAAVEVSRVRMTLPITTPTLAGLAKMQEASKKDPF